MGGRHRGTWIVDGEIGGRCRSCPCPHLTWVDPCKETETERNWFLVSKCYSPGQAVETRWQGEQWSLQLSSDCTYLKLEGVACLEWAAMQN